jgi:ribosomal protein S28E/S33
MKKLIRKIRGLIMKIKIRLLDREVNRLVKRRSKGSKNGQ